MRKKRDRGGIAIEFALSMPLLMLTVAGGLQMGYALMARHALTEATSYATRKAALAAGQGNNGALGSGAIRSDIDLVMGEQAKYCAPLTVTATPGNFAGNNQITVKAICTLDPLFRGTDWKWIPSVTVNAAMPY
jgi:Flp pilus assembly protein TadG